MRVLAITNMYPGPAHPAHGVFVEQQVLGLRRIGLDVDVLHVDRTARGMRVYFEMGPLVDAALAKAPVDIVHVMYGGVMAERLLARRWSQPVIVTFHGSDVFGELLSGTLRRLVSRYGVWCSHRAARRADGIIAVSRVVRSALPVDVDSHKIRIVPCGIDLDRFVPMSRAECRQRLGWSADRFHVLFPANVGDPVKRPELARAAIDAVTARGVRAELHHLRGVQNADVPLWINASDVLLLTSRHEGSPTVVKEALACNVPVVSVDVGDVRERIEGIDGCHLANPTADDLADHLARVAATGARVQSRERIGYLSHLDVARTLEAFYAERLAARSGR